MQTTVVMHTSCSVFPASHPFDIFVHSLPPPLSLPAGVAFSKSIQTNADNIGYIIPYCVVEHFLSEYLAHGSYNGIVGVGFYTQVWRLGGVPPCDPAQLTASHLYCLQYQGLMSCTCLAGVTHSLLLMFLFGCLLPMCCGCCFTYLQPMENPAQQRYLKVRRQHP